MVTLKMTDLQGRVILEQSANTIKGNNTIAIENMSGLQSGVYFIKANIDGETRVFKPIKQ
jgi:hypothetical protein